MQRLRHVSLQESIMKVVGYGRCSTAEQASNGMSIEVKFRALERVAEITAHAGTDRIQHRQYNKRMQTAS